MPLNVYIEPLDTVFFRDNRPFDAGVDTFADSILPSPLVMFGVIGSYYLNKQGVSLREFILNGNNKLGNYDPNLVNSNLKIKGPFFKFGDDIYYPSPFNLWVSEGSPYVLKPQIGINPQWDIQHPDLCPIDISMLRSEPKPFEEYISAEIVKSYLSGNDYLEIDNSRSEETFFLRENRYGHELNVSTLTVKEGQLYISKHLRFTENMEDRLIKKAKFMLFVEGLDKNDFTEITTPIGGEGRMARIYAEEATDRLVPCDNDTLQKIKQSKRFFLYFITPSIFKNGWYGWNAVFDGANMRGACVNKPVFISGWQKSGVGSKGSPRPLLKAVPAGSVYFFEANYWDDTRFERIYSRYHCNESLSDYYPCAGFGTALIGVW
ncbi:MAG: hypothetical protein DDT22_00677 [candidate division WS2 bacterium]|nr:hypothetical protein [Candidatus Lithacetigena glycinireducens]